MELKGKLETVGLLKTATLTLNYLLNLSMDPSVDKENKDKLNLLITKLEEMKGLHGKKEYVRIKEYINEIEPDVENLTNAFGFTVDELIDELSQEIEPLSELIEKLEDNPQDAKDWLEQEATAVAGLTQQGEATSPTQQVTASE
jgi:hypothetical protein